MTGPVTLWNKILISTVVALWTVLAAVTGYCLKPNRDIVLAERLKAFEVRIEDRLREIHRRLAELSERVRRSLRQPPPPNGQAADAEDATERWGTLPSRSPAGRPTQPEPRS